MPEAPLFALGLLLAVTAAGLYLGWCPLRRLRESPRR